MTSGQGELRRPTARVPAAAARLRLARLGWALALAPAASAAKDTAYEDRLERWALALHGRERDPEPDGKRIEEVLVESEEVVAADDPWPALLNLVHIRTKAPVVRQELLFAEGDAYRAELISESERNLRRLPILAVARVIPVKGRTPSGVGVIVVTKDLWSLRLNSEFNLVGTLLQHLRVRPTEQNFLGLGKQLSLDFALRLDTVTLGQQFVDPRLFGTRLLVAETAAIVLGRETGAPEGSRGSLLFGLPLYSLESTWGFGVGGSWNVQRTRVYRGEGVWELDYPDADAPVALVPYVFDRREFGASAGTVRSFGRRFKTDVTASWGAYSRRYEPPPESPLTDDQRAWLAAAYLPLSEDAAFLSASVRAYEATYRVLRDIQTFALAEDYQLGHLATATVRFAHPAFLSPARFVEIEVAARYRLSAFDDLLTVSAVGAIRFMPDAVGPGPWVNRRLAAEVTNLSPRLGPGRLAVRALLDLRADDLDHRIFLLGGGNGLRGAAAEALSGTRMVLVNLEYRTRPIELATLHVGAVAFYDAGSAFDREPLLWHTVGLGVRALFPQFDRQTLRIDIGFVLVGRPPGLVDRFSASFGQVFDYRPAVLP